MLTIVYSILLLLLTGAAFIGGLMGWVALARVRRLEQALEQLRRQTPNAETNTIPEDAQPQTQHTPEARPSASTAGESKDSGKHTINLSQSTALSPSGVQLLLGQLRQSWMTWLGGLCVALAGIFLVKYGIDAGLLGPAARILLACIIGASLHIAALWLRRRTGVNHPAFAALAGAASITLYAAMLAALHLYHLLPPGLVFMVLAAIALGTMGLSLLHGPVLAIAGILGAYSVPILVANQQGDIFSDLIYSLIISAAALLLMRYIYRPWLWYGTLAGALSWWLIAFTDAEAAGLHGYYLAILAYGFLAIPSRDWRIAGIDTSGAAQDIAVLRITRHKRLELPMSAVALLLITLAQAASIAHDGFSEHALLRWSPLVIVVLLASRKRPGLAIAPWFSLVTQLFAWLYSAVAYSGGQWHLDTLAQTQQHQFLWFAAGMSALYSGISLLLSSGNPYQPLRASMTAMAPICWLALSYLLLTDLSGIWQWSLVSLAIGLIYIILAQRILHRDAHAASAIWLILGAHLAYSLAVAMSFREATLTLALSSQLISLTWLIRRFQVQNLDWLVKAILALIVIRLTCNPWLLSYPADIHWSLWTYGGSTCCCMIASRLVAPHSRLRPWLEAVSLQLLVLFIAAETRYQLYDGEIFSLQYSLTEAAINTLLWAGLALVYHYRAQFSDYLNRLYTILSSLLMIIAWTNYLVVLTLLNPLLGGDSVGSQPIFNLLLLAYGAPPLIALLAYRFYQPQQRNLAIGTAAAGGLIFISMEIRHLWQGDLDISLPTSQAELYTYSAAWLLLAVVAIVYASRRHLDLIYKGGMALLIVVIGKLFLIDMAGLEGLLRVASFMGLGLSLLGLAYLYQRISETQKASRAESD